MNQNIPHQVFGSNGTVLLEFKTEGNSVAINHRANLLPLMDFMQGQNPTGAFNRIRCQSADAMRQAGADKLFDDISLQHRPGCNAGTMLEQRTETILKVGMQHNPLVTKFGQKSHRLVSFGRGHLGVAPAGCFEGKELG